MSSPAAVAVTSSSYLLDHHRPFVSMEEQGQDEGDEEEYDVHNPKHPRRFQHFTRLIDVEVQSILIAKLAERSEIDENGTARGEAGAVFLAYSSQVVDSCD